VAGDEIQAVALTGRCSIDNHLALKDEKHKHIVYRKKQYHAPGVFQEAKTAVRWLQSEKINLGPYKVIN